ncbi:hypothetical protein AK812_SmicGene35902 [Symbiodinium microadriaticum]|uniref:Uncharacterized protein n=1 Tax=Symbiodinium microadriaticum TaxID=2951 RepID=A0A1Q9CKA8_SYMMI|nr:hypothetical protein AK812_SmicGene35902 [Symbiodinium microadriaticum]
MTSFGTVLQRAQDEATQNLLGMVQESGAAPQPPQPPLPPPQPVQASGGGPPMPPPSDVAAARPASLEALQDATSRLMGGDRPFVGS